MPEYRYEAVDPSGVPVHGTAEEFDLKALEARLSARNLTLVSATEHTLESVSIEGRQLIPRLFQLRFGEVVREAVLTGMPVHTGLRALAEEPIHHPLLLLRPWCFVVFWAISFMAAAVVWLLEESWSAVFVSLLLIGVGLWAVFQVIEFLVDLAPRKQLREMATRLENGEPIPDSAVNVLPAQVRTLMRSDALTDESRAKIVAELMPSILSDEVHNVRLLGRFAVALFLLPISLIIVTVSVYTLTPPFRRTFEEFSLDVPIVTQFTLWLGDFLRGFGVVGLVVFSLSLLGLVGAAILVVRYRLMWRFLSAIPILGTSCRWQVQSRIARLMAALLGNDCPAPAAIQIAAAGTQVSPLIQAGQRIADRLEQNKTPAPDDLQSLGVPMGILHQDEDQSANDYRQMAVAAFESLGQLLETAAARQSELLVTVVSTCSIVMSAAAIGLMFFSLAFPIIKLLQDLA